MASVPRLDWRGHEHEAVLAELAAAELTVRRALERRHRLVRELTTQPPERRPTVADIGRALGLPGASVGQLARSRPALPPENRLGPGGAGRV